MSRLLPAIAAVALILTGCTASDPLQPVGDTPPDAYAARPIPSAQIDAAVGGLDAMVADVMRRTGVPGMSVAVVRGGEIVYAKGFGVRELGKDAAVDADTVFQLASVSKSVGSTCVSAAVTGGLVSWSDPVVKHLPDFRFSDPEISKRITIADLYAHRSGLPREAGDDLEAFGFDRAGVLARLNQFELDPFRITYHYSNFGMTTGGEAVAAAAKRPWSSCAPNGSTHPSAWPPPAPPTPTSSAGRTGPRCTSARPRRRSSRSTPATRMPSRPPAGSVPRPTTWPAGC